MDDIIAIEYDATPTIANMLALAEQLAVVTADRDALALELSHLRPEWQALRDERDALAAQLAQVDDFGAYCYEWGQDGRTWRPSFAEWQSWREQAADRAAAFNGGEI